MDVGNIIKVDLECKPLEATVNKALEFLERILGPGINQIGGLIGERIGYWRFCNWVSVANKAAQKAEDAGIDPRAVPPDIAVPLLNKGSMTDDDLLQDMFASLLAHAATRNSEMKVHPSYTIVLEQLSPTDAIILAFIASMLRDVVKYYHRTAADPLVPVLVAHNPIHMDDLQLAAQKIGLYISDIMPSLVNLSRLGVINWVQYNITDKEIVHTPDIPNLDLNRLKREPKSESRNEFCVTEYAVPLLEIAIDEAAYDMIDKMKS